MLLFRPQKLVLGLLIMLQSGAPFPWAHRHCDLEHSESVAHRQGFHSCCEAFVSTTWHFHFFDPKHSLPDRSDEQNELAEFAFINPAECEVSLKIDLLNRVNSLGQHAVLRSDGHMITGCEQVLRRYGYCQSSAASQSRAGCALLCTWQI